MWLLVVTLASLIEVSFEAASQPDAADETKMMQFEDQM